MDLQKLKNKIAVVEQADRNIENYQKLKGREIALIPTDSDYYRNFEDWAKKEKIHYDGETEKSPMYMSKSDADRVIDLLIDFQKDFSSVSRADLSIILSKAEGEKLS